MQITIIPNDGAVYKDTYSYSKLDLAICPSNIHALQFNDTSNTGWIEFVDNDNGTKPQNELITALPDWASACLIKWDEAKVAEEAALQINENLHTELIG